MLVEIDSYKCEPQEFLLCYVFSGLPWHLTPYGNMSALCDFEKGVIGSKKITNFKE
jgi:hypothetical protein